MMSKSFKKALGKINNGWVRLAVFIIAGINTGAMMFDVELLPFDNEELVSGLSLTAMVVSELWNHWKNNDWTLEAKHATKYMDAMKAERKDK